ncbi:MAG: hypothetical protein ACI8S6_005956, partial [Myxococcota bacterium]
PGQDEPTIHVDDLRTFLADNRYPESLREKTTDEKGNLLDAVVGLADVAVDAYLPLASSAVDTRVRQVLAERALRAKIRDQDDGMDIEAISDLLAETDYILELDEDKRDKGLAALLAHMQTVGVVKADPETLRWYPGAKLRPTT